MYSPSSKGVSGARIFPGESAEAQHAAMEGRMKREMDSQAGKAINDAV